MLSQLSSQLLFYLPLGIVGLWRWGTWLMRIIVGRFYRPITGEFQTSVSIVVPVYNEKPELFQLALDSWRANNPAEIISVIDATDTSSIGIFQEFSRGFKGAKLIITEKPGKRQALADGAVVANGDIIAFVDSDTIWDDSLLKHALPPFADPSIGGVSTRQNVFHPKTLAQNMFDIQLDLRFTDDMKPSEVAGSAFTCLSGRTALYRRKAVLPFLDDLVNERFWGKQCIGGDDKRLTYLIEAAGWKASYQHNARVYTPGAGDLATLFKQRTRWSRNSWRADLRAMWLGWVWKHPFLSFILIDRAVSTITPLFSLVYFIVSLILGLWIPAIILVSWWHISRALKIMPNLARHPSNIKLIPVYIVVNFATVITRLYALLTMNRQDWLTRGAQKKPRSFGLLLARLGTFAIIAGMILLVYYTRL